MTTPHEHGHGDDGSARIDPPRDFTPTATGADVTGRMSGTRETVRTTDAVRPTDTLRHKTSAAAVFALVFGLAALFCALTAILSPAAVLFGITGIVLGIAGLKMSKRPGVHGHAVAVGGLTTAVLGLLLGGAVIAGAAAIVNSNSQLDRISHKIDQLRSDLPSGSDVTGTVR